MAEITAAQVKALRDLTDLPMMLCKNALKEAEGDQEQAIEILKRDRGKVLLKRADNPTSEGRIFLKVREEGSEAAMVELQCESAPVASNENFLQLGEQLVKQLLDGPGAESPDDLSVQPAPDLEGTTLKEFYEETVGKLREKIVVARVARQSGPISGYVHHDGKTGVLFRGSGETATSPVLRDVAMHIAAMKPTVTKTEELDPAIVQAERDRLNAEAKATGKPDNIVEKIVDGRMKNFYVEQGVLLLQPFAKDDSKTVSQALAEQGLTAEGFTCWVLGN